MSLSRSVQCPWLQQLTIDNWQEREEKCTGKLLAVLLVAFAWLRLVLLFLICRDSRTLCDSNLTNIGLDWEFQRRRAKRGTDERNTEEPPADRGLRPEFRLRQRLYVHVRHSQLDKYSRKFRSNSRRQTAKHYRRQSTTCTARHHTVTHHMQKPFSGTMMLWRFRFSCTGAASSFLDRPSKFFPTSNFTTLQPVAFLSFRCDICNV